jgi:aspartyl-tRNA(Asn)/glutamyl-tRNA(Gln) amidotransferase subunit C
MQLSREQVAHLATLARLHLSDDELAAAQAALNTFIQHTELLAHTDLTNVPPTTHAPALPQLAHMPLRDDTPAPRLTLAAVLANAPEAQDDAFRVPKVVDHG